MLDSTTRPVDRPTPPRWEPVDVLSADEAMGFARTARITRGAAREYMARHIVSDATAEQQLRLLVGRVLQTGRLARRLGGPVLRAHSHKADGDNAYSFLLDLAAGRIVGYRGSNVSWFEGVHPSVEELVKAKAEGRRREEERAQRRAAHEDRMRDEQAAAAARRARKAGFIPSPSWPLLSEGAYDRSGDPVPLPHRRRPITDEDRIRRVGRLPHVVFHSDALNSPFFREVAAEDRCEALRRVLDKVLRAPTKSSMCISSDCITVTRQKVTLTLTPDCAMVRTLNPPKAKGDNTSAHRYRADRWK
ncbi:hypothetical protein [Streptomyces niveus]|uniref:hypothetical protein n=1 Tax=Streptomyces niveus TaxID=193462 RepID=UPI003415FFF0